MKIERECRCGAKASWEDDGVNLLNRLAKHWEGEHKHCVAVPRVVQYVTAPAAPFPLAPSGTPAPGWPPIPEITCKTGQG